MIVLLEKLLKNNNINLKIYILSDIIFLGVIFMNLIIPKKLKKGDEIKYKHNEFEKIYEVEKCRIIKATQVEYLEESEENMLTLITYIENYSQYRWCILAAEKI